MSALSLPAPHRPPQLDPGFRPLILALDAYAGQVEASAKRERLVVGLERESDCFSRFEMDVAGGKSELTLRLAERIVKFLLWSRGGRRLYIGGPNFLAEHIAGLYSEKGERSFDAALMRRVYEQPFEAIAVRPEEVPPENEGGSSLGGHLDGCRIGFDLGASDYKVAAIRDGETLFSAELPWNPKEQADPSYHYTHIQKGLGLAASHLPRVDAIGGSSAGVLVNNRVMIASLFRSVPDNLFQAQVRDIFLRIKNEWNVPTEVINDGEVSALAGSMSLGRPGLLGIAMGSSQAAGYMDRNGRITGRLDELAFAPVDLNPEAPVDEWSGDRGAGVSYFSQQAVSRLAAAAGISFPSEVDLPQRLKLVQEKADHGDQAALSVFETIGVYLGYSIPLYARFYDGDDILILGRVTSGAGGEVLANTAREILAARFPVLAERVALHMPDEKSRRVGQAVAAASLPEVTRAERSG